MTTVTQQTIEEFRSILTDNNDAQDALQIIEECNGNLEDALSVLIDEAGVGETLMGTEEWIRKLKELVKRCQDIICQEKFKKGFINGIPGNLLIGLISEIAGRIAASAGLEMGNLPPKIATIIASYVLKEGINQICQSAEFSS